MKYCDRGQNRSDLVAQSSTFDRIKTSISDQFGSKWHLLYYSRSVKVCRGSFSRTSAGFNNELGDREVVSLAGQESRPGCTNPIAVFIWSNQRLILANAVTKQFFLQFLAPNRTCYRNYLLICDGKTKRKKNFILSNLDSFFFDKFVPDMTKYYFYILCYLFKKQYFLFFFFKCCFKSIYYWCRLLSIRFLMFFFFYKLSVYKQFYFFF